MWTGVGVGMGLQLTIEVMDGFSEKWGFSLPDVGFNTLGVSLFAAQELLWQEQRLVPKISATPVHYSTAPLVSVDGSQVSSLAERARDLYGSSYLESFLKDYNAQTYWLSVNLASFMQEQPVWLPRWLNVAVGYGAGNMFGGYENRWPEGAPEFILSEAIYPRYQQYYLSLDVDLRKIPAKKRWVRGILGVLNFVKIPAPALEINSLGTVRFHPIRW